MPKTTPDGDPLVSLPNPLVYRDGSAVGDANDWFIRRRPELLKLFASEVYGSTPKESIEVTFEIVESDAGAYGGRATRKQIVGHVGNGQLEMDLLLYLPNDRQGPAPLFLALNFYGNHTISPDPAIRLPRSWVRSFSPAATLAPRATEASRGARGDAWPVEVILARGYALATIYYGDLDPDYDDGFQNGIHPLFYATGQTRPADDEWGSIGAWAWGLSRAMDYVETDSDLDARHVAVMGHSRLGKTALWAGAQDERFALVISNNSGCGGAALSRRDVGETVAAINERFPHWFCRRFHAYGSCVDRLPVDQHQLIALMAPRPVYVASAEDDDWADPEGEYLSAKLASSVYELLGCRGLPGVSMPPINRPLRGSIGYHIRTGGHGVTTYDWQCFMDFSDHHWTRHQ